MKQSEQSNTALPTAGRDYFLIQAENRKLVEANKLLNCLKKGTGYLEHIPHDVATANRDGCQISAIKSCDRPLLDLTLAKLIQDIMEFNGVNWPGSVVVRLLDTIIRDYWHMKIEEVAMVITRPRKTFGKPSPNDVLEWLREYDNGERDAYFEAEALKYKEPYEKVFFEAERRELAADRQALDTEIKREQFRDIAKRIVQNK